MNLLIPVSWLRDYLKTDVAAKTIANLLTTSGPSVDRIEKVGEDYIFDTEITTNRPDAFSVYGVAREAHAILASSDQKSQLIAPKGQDINLEPDKTATVSLDAKVTSTKLCPRFTAIVIEMKVGPSPALIQNRLRAAGIRPINNIVDITNYVMLETGQPMHAFDFNKIQGAKMTLRASREGESITTLDGKKHKLPAGSIIIEDSKRVIDLCGIMGGENSQITARTKQAVFFTQAYDPITIRKTTQALAFRTEASNRFEKGIDLENILPTLGRSIHLAKQIAKAKIISELIDIYPVKQKSATIRLNLEKLNKYLGTQIAAQKAAKILESLGFKAQLSANQISAQAPSWRANDIKTDVDLIEEIARLNGYSNLPSTLPSGQPPNRQDSILKQVISLKNFLKGLGLTEVITYSIISKNLLQITDTREKNAVELANPLTAEWQFMRPSTVPSLLDVISKNRNLSGKIQIFEVAKTYELSHSSSTILSSSSRKRGSCLPIQDLKIAFALSGSNFTEIKGIVENLFQELKRKPKFEKFSEESTLLDNNQAAVVKIGDESAGNLGMVNPKAANFFGLDNNVAIAELNLSTIYNQPSITQTYHPIPKFPPIIEDISTIFSVYTPIGDIIAEIKKASTLIKNIEILDIYENPKLGQAKKSITLTLTYQKMSGTPTQEEVNLEREKIVKSLETNLRAKVRK